MIICPSPAGAGEGGRRPGEGCGEETNLLVAHLHAAEIAHAPDVVAREVHEHDVFGAFLRVGEKFLLQCGVLVRRLAATARAGDGKMTNEVKLLDSRRAHTIKLQWIGRHLRVRKTELTGKNLQRTAARRPVA